MKLVALSEAKHLNDPAEQFEENFLSLGEEEKETGRDGTNHLYRMWYPKTGFLITIEWDDGSDLSIHRIVSGKEGSGSWHHEVYPNGWDDPIELHEGLQELDVWKKVS